jgi:hypothetical protein
LPQADASKQAPVQARKTLQGQNRGASAPSADPRLADVIALWTILPEALRAGIVAMVKAASGQAEGGR